MLIPVNSASGDLNPLADCIVHRSICNYDITPLTESWDDTADCREGLSIYNARWRTEVGRDIGFGLDVYILSAVEARRGARAYAVGTQDLYSLFFEGFVCDEVVKIVGGEVGDRTAVGELGLRTCGPDRLSALLQQEQVRTPGITLL